MQYNYLVTVHNLPCLLVVLMMNHRTQTISQTCICFSMQCRPTDRLQSKQSIFANKGYLSHDDDDTELDRKRGSNSSSSSTSSSYQQTIWRRLSTFDNLFTCRESTNAQLLIIITIIPMRINRKLFIDKCWLHLSIMLTRLSRNQCDQIWRNFVTFPVKFKKLKRLFLHKSSLLSVF